MNRLLNRAGKVKQELEHILDDDADMLVSDASGACEGSTCARGCGQGQSQVRGYSFRIDRC
jgi:hypothetical protein